MNHATINNDIKRQTLDLLAQGKTKEAMELMFQKLPYLKHDIVKLQNRFANNERKKALGTIDYDRYKLELALIIEGITTLFQFPSNYVHSGSMKNSPMQSFLKKQLNFFNDRINEFIKVRIASTVVSCFAVIYLIYTIIYHSDFLLTQKAFGTFSIVILISFIVIAVLLIFMKINEVYLKTNNNLIESKSEEI